MLSFLWALIDFVVLLGVVNYALSYDVQYISLTPKVQGAVTEMQGTTVHTCDWLAFSPLEQKIEVLMKNTLKKNEEWIYIAAQAFDAARVYVFRDF